MFIEPDKRSKRQRKADNAKNRKTWGEFSPRPRIRTSGKVYDRKKLRGCIHEM